MPKYDWRWDFIVFVFTFVYCIIYKVVPFLSDFKILFGGLLLFYLQFRLITVKSIHSDKVETINTIESISDLYTEISNSPFIFLDESVSDENSETHYSILISKEDFFKNIHFFNKLKIKLKKIQHYDNAHYIYCLRKNIINDDAYKLLKQILSKIDDLTINDDEYFSYFIANEDIDTFAIPTSYITNFNELFDKIQAFTDKSFL